MESLMAQKKTRKAKKKTKKKVLQKKKAKKYSLGKDIERVLRNIDKAKAVVSKGRDMLRDAVGDAKMLLEDTDEALLDVHDAHRMLEGAADRISQTI